MKHLNKIKTGLLVISCLPLMGCPTESIDLGNNKEETAHQVNLIKEQQRIKRFDCNGQLTSDKIEVVRRARRGISIPPPSYINLSGSSITNTTTGSSGAIYDRDTFYINYSPTFLDYEVDKGLNVFEYTFNYCEEFKADEVDENNRPICLVPGESHSGRFYIFVNYITEFNNDVLEYIPTKEDCERKVQQISKGTLN